jgi:polyisoprenoid-binding protein YceI
MAKRVLLVLAGLVTIGLVVAGSYYLWLTAPVTVSSVPPAAPTLAPSPRAGETAPTTRLYRIDPTRSEALYRVDETFFDQRGFVVVTGTTRGVAGDILLNPTDLPSAQVGEIVVDVSQLATDEPSRDNAIRRAYLESLRYPLARFTGATILNAPRALQEGVPVRFQLQGTLTVRETPRQVTWDVEAHLQGDLLSATATLPIRMTDFGIEPPRLAMLTVEDEVLLTLRVVAAAAPDEIP